jgi:hypothetical protein
VAPTTSSVLQAARTSIASQSGAHVNFLVSSGSSTVETIAADVGTATGHQQITDGKATLRVRVTPAYAYVSGNSSGLTSIFGLSSSQAKKVGSRWISWKSGTKEYSTLKSSVTLSAVTALLPNAKGTTLSTVTSGSSTLYRLSWTTAATSSVPKLANALTLTAGGPTLPVKASSGASGKTATTTLSDWGEHVVVVVPPASATMPSSELGS